MEDQASWRERRREASIEQAAALERRKAAESAEAQVLLTNFVRELTERGVEPEALRAPVVGSGTSYRTTIRGWYLRKNRSVGVDTEANFYILGTTASLAARLTGVQVLASDPPLVVGQGGRDGESIKLVDLLDMRRAEILQ
ncbi:hypothetical protein E1263_21590 [Kribbella antibiotica]|uniref:Uncharacterized protein n=1 Tax=Kribbella antibiotica TaxID=190195 RepID=A0A4V2YPG3_9ACTN|nr:hypothetical protein [Kribbella antibiotica]TDD57887.1 hypothetical protein E1263_21590 [Kribbella antibiotica]